MKKNKVIPYLFLLVPMAFILIVMIYPLFQSFYYSLTNFYFLDSAPPHFIGFKNYINLFSNQNFLIAFRNSMFFLIIYVPTMVLLSVVIGSLLDTVIRGTVFYRTLIFMPVCVGLTMATLMWVWILGSGGLIDAIFNFFHLSTIQWLATDKSTVITAVIITIWKYLGFNVILILTGIYAIPKELYDAASIDGADRIKSFFLITIPRIKDSISLVIIVSLISSVKVFEQIWAVGRGGGSVDVLYTFMYKTSFRYFEMGEGAAVAYIMAMLVLVISYINIKYIKTEG